MNTTSIIFLIIGPLLLGYSAGYLWRGVNEKPRKYEDFCALVAMPIVGIIFLFIGIILFF